MHPVLERREPEKPAIEKKPALKRIKREKLPLRPKEPAPVIAAPAAPATSTPSDGDALMSSAAAETRAAGRRAYGRLVWTRIAERKPAGIRLAGTAHVTFSVTADGAIGAIAIDRSSGNAELDALALRTIRGAAPFAPPPAGLATEDLVFEIPFNFR